MALLFFLMAYMKKTFIYKMCFGNLYPFTYVVEDNLKLEILKIHPRLHLLFQCSPQCQITARFFFFSFFVRYLPYLIKGGEVGEVGWPSWQFRSSRAVLSMKVLVPPKLHLGVFAADWSSLLAQLSWRHSAIRGREPLSKCGEISTVLEQLARWLFIILVSQLAGMWVWKRYFP